MTRLKRGGRRRARLRGLIGGARRRGCGGVLSRAAAAAQGHERAGGPRQDDRNATVAHSKRTVGACTVRAPARRPL